jgi:purine-binding chemotaxis protein CheW
MSKTPEEYFQNAEFSTEPDEATEFTQAERAFLEKYLGIEEEDILEKLGIDAPVEAESVPLVEEEPEPEAEAEAAPPEPEPEAAPPEPEAEAAPPEPEPEAAPPQPEELVQEAAREAVEEVGRPEEAAEAVEEEAEAEPTLDAELRSAAELQLVSFYIGEQEYTTPIQSVQEVVRYVEPTKLPETPSYLAGIVNLRGRVTPVLYLREMLKIPQQAEHGERFIIVCHSRGMQVGLLVDKVATMYRVRQDKIEWNIESRLGGDVEFVTALMKKDEDELVGVVSAEKIIDKVVAK